jgi:hypothetical protein
MPIWKVVPRIRDFPNEIVRSMSFLGRLVNAAGVEEVMEKAQKAEQRADLVRRVVMDHEELTAEKPAGKR